MAKDPAVLWYWGDWYSGTALMSRFLKGCYMDLLHAQFNNGPLSLEEIKTCLGSDFGQAWPTLQKKFKSSDAGLFFNEKLESEKNKRMAFTESRRQSRLGKNNNVRKTYEKRTIPRTENENEDVNENVSKVGGVGEGISEMELGKTVEYARITLHRDYDQQRVSDLWKAFCIQQSSKFYPDQGEKINHFRNWLKTQPYDKQKPGTSTARMDSLANWGRKVS